MLGKWSRRGEWGLIVAIAAVIVLTILFDPQRNYLANPSASAVDIARQTAMLGIFALGSALVIIAGGIDLSCGSVIAFSGTMCAVFMTFLAPEAMQNAQPVGQGVIVLSILGALLVGFLIGSLHAWLITVVGLPPFVATLATLVGLRSLGRAIVENVTEQIFHGRSTQIQIYDPHFRYLATSVWIPVIVFLALAVVAWLMMSRTVVGRHLYALGGNEAATRLSGIRTERLKWLAYCIGAMLSSLAGVLYIGDQSVADPQTLGRGYELNAIAASVVGGCSLAGGVGSIPGTVLGCLFLRVVTDGIAKIIKSGADVYEGLIVGSVVVTAVSFNQWRQANSQRRAFFSGALGYVTLVNLTLTATVVGWLVGGALVGWMVAPTALALLVGLKVLQETRDRSSG